jgi:hypothetical protein
MTTLIVFLSLAAAAAIGACSEPGAQSAHGRDAGSHDVVAALCEARAEIARDLGAAEAIFFDRTHDRLHDLARDTAEMDRSAAARLLEAKQTVEADLDEDAPRRVLAKDFDALIASTRRAVEVTSGLAPHCPEGRTGD